MEFICDFVGGRYGGRTITLQIAEKATTTRSRDWSKERAAGCLVPRAELDNRPTFDGYLGPMWDGLRYQFNGKMYSDWEVKRVPALAALVESGSIEPIGVLRYETQAVYDALSI